MDLIKLETGFKELPVKVILSVSAIIDELTGFANDEDHPYYKSSKDVLSQINQYPELREGIDNFDDLHKYEEILKLIFKPLFPDLLQTNEIKAVSIPFSYTSFLPTKRLKNILQNAGEDYKLIVKGLNFDKTYLYACSYILAKYYQQPILKANLPTYIDIPNKQTGQMHHYRLMINADYLEVEKTDIAPELTQQDIDELLMNGENMELWKEKFPPGGYTLKGFGIMNLYDSTPDVVISQTRSIFLRKDEDVFNDFQESIRNLFGLNDLQIGISLYNTQIQRTVGSFFNKESRSLFLDNGEEVDYNTVFCDGFSTCVIEQSRPFAIADTDLYGQYTRKNPLYHKLKSKGIKSIILAPMRVRQNLMQVLEIASTRKNELNSISAAKLESIIPFVKIAAERYLDESENIIESTIQENYTSIHPTVKWRFTEAATHFNAEKLRGVESPVLQDIVFDSVYPLYGQSDIVGSSTARNRAIQADLELQMSMVIETLEKVMDIQHFPIYKNLIHKVKGCLRQIQKGLNAGDEMEILDFLKKDIYPVFNHVKTLSPELGNTVKQYMSHIDPFLKVVYRKRKAYDDSVSMINEKLTSFLDRRQEEAQRMFPHYFERYKTDGVEYNMYIGGSLVQDQIFHPIYLKNLRLWQLETMCKIEQVALNLLDEMPYPLRVASLILVHNNPLSIKFHMDQKQFDVDGAYNARYEIIKKRIDKSHIKGTNQRLTQAGKIAIVYSQDNDAQEYLEYVKYLQSENKLGKVELLELEDLQGMSGLKAIRVEVIYQEKEQKTPKAKVKRKQKEALLAR